jgi:hypothetical protein
LPRSLYISFGEYVHERMFLFLCVWCLYCFGSPDNDGSNGGSQGWSWTVDQRGIPVRIVLAISSAISNIVSLDVSIPRYQGMVLAVKWKRGQLQDATMGSGERAANATWRCVPVQTALMICMVLGIVHGTVCVDVDAHTRTPQASSLYNLFCFFPSARLCIPCLTLPFITSQIPLVLNVTSRRKGEVEPSGWLEAFRRDLNPEVQGFPIVRVTSEVLFDPEGDAGGPFSNATPPTPPVPAGSPIIHEPVVPCDESEPPLDLTTLAVDIFRIMQLTVLCFRDAFECSCATRDHELAITTLQDSVKAQLSIYQWPHQEGKDDVYERARARIGPLFGTALHSKLLRAAVAIARASATGRSTPLGVFCRAKRIWRKISNAVNTACRAASSRPSSRPDNRNVSV